MITRAYLPRYFKVLKIELGRVDKTKVVMFHVKSIALPSHVSISLRAISLRRRSNLQSFNHEHSLPYPLLRQLGKYPWCSSFFPIALAKPS